jgi:hypothetical protein
MNARPSALYALALALLASPSARASSTGMTGASRIGCGGASNCHGASSLSTTVRIEGPSSVVRGSMTTFELIISNSGLLQDTAGFDLATSGGTLETDARATQTQTISNELTHRAPLAQTSGGTWRIPFRFVAPTSGSSAMFTFAANATNANFSSRGDQWSTGTFSVSITDTMMADSGVAMPDASPPSDAAVADSGARDAGAIVDAASSSDANSTADSATADASADSGAQPSPQMPSGCSVSRRAPASPRATGSLVAALLALACVAHRRKR